MKVDIEFAFGSNLCMTLRELIVAIVEGTKHFGEFIVSDGKPGGLYSFSTFRKTN